MPTGVYRHHKQSEETITKRVKSLIGKKRSPEVKEVLSLMKKGKKLSEEHKLKLSIARKKFYENGGEHARGMLGKKHTVEHRRKLSEANKGEKSYMWKGGVEIENNIIRKGIDYRLWREAVFARDSFTCKNCKKVGGDLNADHIKPFALFPELRFAIDNGRTLCAPCHLEVTREQHKMGIFKNSVETRFKKQVPTGT